MERKGMKLFFLTDWFHQITIRRRIVRDTDVVTEESVSKRLDGFGIRGDTGSSGLLVAAYGDSADLAIG